MPELTIAKQIYDLLAAANIKKSNTMVFGSIAIGTSATVIRPETLTRTGLIIQNVSGADVYIGGSGVTTSNGIKLEPGDVYENQDWIGAIYGVATVASSDIRYQHFFTS